MHSVHGSLSIAIPLLPDSNDSAKKILDRWAEENENGHTFFEKCPSTLGVTASIIREQEYGKKILPKTLLFVTTFSGPLSSHLDELIEFGERELRELFRWVEGYSVKEDQYRTALKKFLYKSRVTDAFYSGAQNLRLLDIQREFALKKKLSEIVTELKTDPTFKDQLPENIKDSIEKKLKLDSRFDWVESEIIHTGFLNWYLLIGRPWLLRIALVLIVVAIGYAWYFLFGKGLESFRWTGLISSILIAFLAIAITGILTIVLFELFEDGSTTERPKDEESRAIAATQLNPVINELTAAGPVKPGGFRRIIYALILKTALRIQVKPSIATVVAARWIGLDGCRRLVFVSNFANTAEFYVRDFVDSKKSAHGINLLFGHGLEFPKTRLLSWNGALSDPEAFLNVFLKNQHVTGFWYCPHKHLTVDNININHRLRQGLYKRYSSNDANNWLQLI